MNPIRCLRLRASLAACCLALPAAAAAQEGVLDQLPAIDIAASALVPPAAPDTAAVQQEMAGNPGNVTLVPDSAWRDGPSATLKDVLDLVPGIFVQPKWGEDARLSIRGSGLSRNFHLRGIQLYQDGVPLGAADGSADFQEIDPTAYSRVEVFRGGNGLRYGANSLGGALNLVTPTGHDAPGLEGRVDAGSFGFRRLQAAAGGAYGDFDGHISASLQRQDGFRDHSAGHAARAAANLGWRIGENAGTRFRLSLADVRQEIPGTVTKTSALTQPKAAAPANLAFDYQRNIEAVRISNLTSFSIGPVEAELGTWFGYRHLDHPIYQYLDYRYRDYGGSARAVHEGSLAGHGNRLVLGASWFGGEVDNRHYVNLPGGAKGAPLSSSTDRSDNLTLYGEDRFELRPGLSLVTGLQYLAAGRRRSDTFPAPPDTSGRAEYRLLNPRAGLVWQAGPDWQLFGNLTRSSEVPTFSELNFANVVLSELRPQTATTAEIGSRGRWRELEWDLALYRAWLRDEFQYFDLGGGNYQVSNADRTLHQGAELGLRWTFLQGLLRDGAAPDALRLQAAYTFSDFRFDGDPVWGDNRLPGAPRHFLRADLLYRSPAGFELGPTLEWVPEAYPVDNANSQYTQPYALFGFRAAYAAGPHLDLFVTARNLADTPYIASASVAAVANPGSALYEPGNGRSVQVGLRLTW